MDALNKTELIAALADETGLSNAKTQKVFNALLALLAESLKQGRDVAIRRFGTFTWSKVDKQGEESQVVLFRVSPYFTSLCSPPAEEEGNEAPAEEESVLFSELRGLLNRPPSQGGWDKIVHCFQTWPQDSPDRQLALEYAQTHLDAGGWSPYGALTERTPHAQAADASCQADTAPPTGPAGHPRLARELMERNERIQEFHKINQQLKKHKKASLPDFLASIQKTTPLSTLAMTNNEIHVSGWTHAATQHFVEQHQKLSRARFQNTFKNKGLSVLLRHNNTDGHDSGDRSEGSVLITYDGEILLTDPDADASVLIQAKGTLDYQFNSRGELNQARIVEDVVLLADQTPILSDFDKDLYDEDDSESCEEWDEDDCEEWDEDDYDEPRLMKAAAKLHGVMQQTFPDAFPTAEESKDTKKLADWLEAVSGFFTSGVLRREEDR